MRGTFADAWNIRPCVEHRGAHQGRFHSPRRFSEARVRKKGSGAHGTALWRPGLARTASQLFSGKLGANHIPAPEATRQSSQQPRQHHTPTRINHISSTRNYAPIKPAAQATPRINNIISATSTASPTPKPRVNHATSHGRTASPATKAARQPNHHHRQHHAPTTYQRRLHQRFLYCDGETPNISLKYFAKYFCVPKPTASETSTTLSPASADNS